MHQATSEVSSRGLRVFLFLMTTFLFVANWGRFLYWGVNQWPTTPEEVRVNMIFFAAIFPVPWIQLLREKLAPLKVVALEYVVLTVATQLVVSLLHGG